MRDSTFISYLETQERPCVPCAEDSRGICFAHKLRTIQFGVGTANAKRDYFDKEALESQIGNLDDNAAYAREATEGYGPLRWSKGEAYYQDKTTGGYSKLSASDLEKVLYGSAKPSIDPV